MNASNNDGFLICDTRCQMEVPLKMPRLISRVVIFSSRIATA